MRNVEEVFSRVPTFRIRMQGAPPPSGWAVRYLSGMEEASGIEPGYWLSQWHVSSDHIITFNFEPELVLTFNTEIAAAWASNALRESAEIETGVLKVG
jgi:hypothetical protein